MAPSEAILMGQTELVSEKRTENINKNKIMDTCAIASVLDILITISAEAAEMRKRRRLILNCWLHAWLLHLGAYYMHDLEELSRIDIGSLNRCIRRL